jgi:hypothetical protein
MSGHFDHPHHHIVDGNAEFENEIMTSTLTTVIGGAPSTSSLTLPPVLESSQPRDLASTYMPGGAHLPSQMDANLDLDETTFVLRRSPLPPVKAGGSCSSMVAAAAGASGVVE